MLLTVNNSNRQLKPYNLSWRNILLQVLCYMDKVVLDDDTGDLLEYQHLICWTHFQEAWGRLYGNELVQLAQGMPSWVNGKNIIVFIHKQSTPSDQFKDVTYKKIVYDYKENKGEHNQTQLTVGDDRIYYPGDCVTLTAYLLTVKLIFDSVVSIKNV